MNYFAPSPLKIIHTVSACVARIYTKLNVYLLVYWGLHQSQNEYDWIISCNCDNAVFFNSSTIANKHTNINNVNIITTSAGVGLQLYLSRDLPPSRTVCGGSSSLQKFKHATFL